jgi:uncharacterized membrane protein
MDPAHLDFNPHLFHYGGCFIYTVGLALKAASLFDWITLTPDLSFYFNHPEAMGKIYIVGRLVVILSVFVSAFLIYSLGKMLYGKETGLFSALIFAISPGVVASAHIMKPHLFGVCFVLLFLIVTLKMKEKGSRSWYILSGFVLGLAIGSVVYLAIFIIYFITGHLLRSASSGIKGYLISLKDKNLLLALCSLLFAFLLTNPYYLISFKEVLYEKAFNLRLFSFRLSFENLGDFTFNFFTTIHGITLSLFVFLGLFYSLTKGRELWFLPLLPVFYFLIASAVIRNGTPPNFRFALSLIPFTSLLAGIAIFNLWALRKKWIRILLVAALTMALSHSLLYAFNFKQDTSSGGTFLRAGEWINQNVPEGSSVGLMQLFIPSTTPPFDFRSFRITVYTPRELSSGKKYLSQYFVSTKRIDDFLVPHYQIIQSFPPAWPLSMLKFEDHFALANRQVFIYQRVDQ